MEAAYQPRLTFKDEPSSSSGAKVSSEAKADQVLGCFASLQAKRILAASVTGRVEARTVDRGGHAVGLGVDTIGEAEVTV